MFIQNIQVMEVLPVFAMILCLCAVRLLSNQLNQDLLVGEQRTKRCVAIVTSSTSSVQEFFVEYKKAYK